MTEALPPAGEKKKREWVSWVVCFALAALAVYFMSTEFDDGPVDYDERMTTLCQKVARDNALAPTTVQFTDDVQIDRSQEPTSWTVSGTMDGQNVFGAMLRTTYSCDVTYRSDEGKFYAKLLR